MSLTRQPLYFGDKGARGFSLLELAIAMALIGIILGGALLIVGKLWQLDRREETILYLQEAKAALLRYAEKNGKLPLLDTTTAKDGIGDLPYTVISNGHVGWLPFVDIGVRARDAFGVQPQYSVTKYLQADRSTSCSNLKDFYSRLKNPADTNYAVGWWPRLWEKGMAANTGAPVAAVIISPGENKWTYTNPSSLVGNFDSIANRETNEPTPNNDRFQANKSFASYPHVEGKFDDILVYISFAEMYQVLKCGELADDDSLNY